MSRKQIIRRRCPVLRRMWSTTSHLWDRADSSRNINTALILDSCFRSQKHQQQHPNTPPQSFQSRDPRGDNCTEDSYPKHLIHHTTNMATESTPATILKTTLETITAYIRNLNVPNPLQSTKDTTPESWICHHCVYLLPAVSAAVPFATQSCRGCGHERCGRCDVVCKTVDENSMWYDWHAVDETTGKQTTISAPAIDENTGEPTKLSVPAVGA